MHAVNDSPALADLAAAFPAWHMWRGHSSTGRDTYWHATRLRRLTAAETAAGMLARLSAGTAASLWALLEQQQVLEGKDQAAL